MGNAAPALAMVAAFALIVAGTRLVLRRPAGSSRKQGTLMIVAATVLVLNVLIWTI